MDTQARKWKLKQKAMDAQAIGFVPLFLADFASGCLQLLKKRWRKVPLVYGNIDAIKFL